MKKLSVKLRIWRQKNQNDDLKEKKAVKEKKVETKKLSNKKSPVKSVKSKPKAKKVSKK